MINNPSELNQKGFIQIPILIAIIVGLLVVGGASYFSIKQYQNYQAEKVEKEKVTQEKEKQSRDLEIDTLRVEMEALKNQKPETITQTIIKEVSVSKIDNASLSNTPIVSDRSSTENIFDKISPAIVFIKTSNGSGSGMIIENNGLILTNAHVIFGVDTAIITLQNKQSYEATVVGRNENIDIALLKISGNNFPTVDLGDSDFMKQGEEIFALGFPYGFTDETTITKGILSARQNLDGTQFLQIDLQILPGNSGGAIVDKMGKVVGMSTLLIDRANIGEYLKFALPINLIKQNLASLKIGNNTIVADELTPEKKAALQGQLTSIEDLILNYNKLVGVGVFDDHELHIALHQENANDTPARYAHIRAHQRAISLLNGELSGFENFNFKITTTDLKGYYNNLPAYIEKLKNQFSECLENNICPDIFKADF